MEAKHDVTVTDGSGMTRKVFAGTTVPRELEGHYRQAVSEQSDDDKGKSVKAPEVDKSVKAPEVDKAVQAPETSKTSRRKN